MVVVVKVSLVVAIVLTIVVALPVIVIIMLTFQYSDFTKNGKDFVKTLP